MALAHVALGLKGGQFELDFPDLGRDVLPGFFRVGDLETEKLE